MDKHEELVRPELVIVTDGLDKDVPTMKRKDFGSTVVHAFIIGMSDPDLERFARGTGGTSVFL